MSGAAPRRFRDPFRYPQWLEGVFAGMWLLWSVVNFLSPESLTERPGLAILNHFLGWLWPWVGFLLFSAHAWALRMGSLVGRSLSASVGFLVLLYAFLTVGAANLEPVAPTLVFLLGLVSISGILSWRLWRRYA